MASMKKPGPLLLSTGSDEDSRKPPKNVASSEWPLKAVAILLDIYVQKFSAGRGYLRGKDWEEVMTKVNTECEFLKTLKTMKQCRDKVDSLKRRYKMEKRKAVNGNEVTWPFFSKLDDMMGSVFKQARGFEPLDRQQKSLLYYSHGDDEDDDDDDDDKQGFSGSPEDCRGVDSRHYDMHFYMDHLENGKARAEERDAMSEEGFNLHHSYQAPLKLLSLTGAQISTDNSSGQGRHSLPPLPGATSKSGARKREPDNPMQALADALTGFSEVYARVELAKMEIFTTMKLELAKLGRKRRKKHNRKNSPSQSSTSSG